MSGKIKPLCHSLWVDNEAPTIHPIRCLELMNSVCGTGHNDVEMKKATSHMAQRFAVYLTDMELHRFGLIPASAVDQGRVPEMTDPFLRGWLISGLEARPSSIGNGHSDDHATIVVTDGASGLGDAIVTLNTKLSTNFSRRADPPHLLCSFDRHHFGPDQRKAFHALGFQATTPKLRRAYVKDLRDDVLDWCLKNFTAHSHRRQVLSRSDQEQVLCSAVCPAGDVHPINVSTTGSSETIAGYLLRIPNGEDVAVRQLPHDKALFAILRQFSKTASSDRQSVLDHARTADGDHDTLTPYGRNVREYSQGAIDRTTLSLENLLPADRELPEAFRHLGVQVSRDPSLFAGRVEFKCQPVGGDDARGMACESHEVFPLDGLDPRSHLPWVCTCGTMLIKGHYCRGVLEAAQSTGLRPEWPLSMNAAMLFSMGVYVGLTPTTECSNLPITDSEYPHLVVNGIRVYSGQPAQSRPTERRVPGHSASSRIKSTVGPGSPFKVSSGAALVSHDGDADRVAAKKRRFRQVANEHSSQTCGHCSRPGHYHPSCAGLDEDQVQAKEESVGMRLEARRSNEAKTALGSLTAEARATLATLALTAISQSSTGSVPLGLLQERAEAANVTPILWKGWSAWVESLRTHSEGCARIGAAKTTRRNSSTLLCTRDPMSPRPSRQLLSQRAQALCPLRRRRPPRRRPRRLTPLRLTPLRRPHARKAGVRKTRIHGTHRQFSHHENCRLSS